jgi:hypothetical protein
LKLNVILFSKRKTPSPVIIGAAVNNRTVCATNCSFHMFMQLKIEIEIEIEIETRMQMRMQAHVQMQILIGGT